MPSKFQLFIISFCTITLNNIGIGTAQVINQNSNLLLFPTKVQTANTALEQAREALRLGRLRFQAGVCTQTDVINAQNNLTRAEGTRSQAILNYNRALAQIQRALTKR